MLRNAKGITSALLLMGGLVMLLYPIFSNWYEEVHHGEVIRTYQEDVAELDQEELAGARAEAEAYNTQLHELVLLADPFAADFEKQNITYNQLLNENADGVMSYIEIPSIDVYLPIYHGTSETELAKGAGHLINTSLPVGGASTHCVISAHRGDPSATLFSDLDQLKEGDVFHLHTLGEIFSYQVDQVKVVLPYETDDFRITEGKDYVTLVTCTPYGVNSHRLLVRGERIAFDYATEDLSHEAAAVSNERPPFDYTAYVAYGGVTSLLLIAGCIIWFRKRRIRHQ